MIADVYLWSNGMVMAFDECGQQMPQYQGAFHDVRETVVRDASPETRFYGGQLRNQRFRISRSVFDPAARPFDGL